MDLTTHEEILKWYESEPRYLQPEFLSTIRWQDVRKHPLPDEFVATLYYMRDEEKMVDRYAAELRTTPTGKNPFIRRFMERWGEEEVMHGDLINRFLEEAGYPSEERWAEKIRARISPWQKLRSQVIIPLVTNRFGEGFSAVHMTWGAINEYTTMNGYARLRMLAKHPVLDTLLTGIMREESRHAQYYWRAAKVYLDTSGYARKISRFFIDRFWVPVGQGTKPKKDTDAVIRALFRGEEGVKYFENRVSNVIRQLPGFKDCTTITKAIASAALA